MKSCKNKVQKQLDGHCRNSSQEKLTEKVLVMYGERKSIGTIWWPLRMNAKLLIIPHTGGGSY